MKRFTILFSVLLVLGFGGVLAYVAASPEFVPPAALIGEGEDPDAPIWDMTMDEVLAELAAQGLIDDPASAISLASDGLCTDARQVETAYKSLKSDGVIDLYGSGHILSYVHNGPFAMWLDLYEGDPGALEQAFKDVGQAE